MSARHLFRRVPFVPQMEMAECAAASLGMVLGYHGCHVPLAELRETCGVSRDGASALDIVTAAQGYGLDVAALQIELDALPELALPAILHWDFNHFLVLERLTRHGADIVDPASGRRRISREELGRGFTGVALELEPGEDFRTRRRARSARSALRALTRRMFVPLSLMTASALLLEVFALLFPAATALVVDFVIRPRQESWLAILAVAFTLAVVLRAAITIARDRVLAVAEARLDVALGTLLVSRLLAAPTSFSAPRDPGDLSSRVAGILAAREKLARVFLIGFDLLLVTAYAALMLLYDLGLGGLVVGVQLLAATVVLVGRRGVRGAATTSAIEGGRAQSALVQAFGDAETVKAFRAERFLEGRYVAARTKELNARAVMDRSLEPARHAMALAEAAGVGIVLGVGGGAVLDDRMTLGVLASFFAIHTLLAAPVQRIVAALRDLGDLGPLFERADDLLETAPEPGGAFVPDRIRGAVTFEHVSFRYSRSAPLLLDDVSFHIAPGERVAIVGPSGAGKSTILRLLLGFVRPTAGRILLDGRDLRDHDLGALRAAVGTVLASGAFFDESVFDNVTLGAPHATADDVGAALDAACVADVVAALPQGLQTPLGPGAARLSGGQRQRLLLARALVKRPALLLLDEASSALDTQLEARVQGCLARVRCTMLVIAHRASAIAFADRVLVLERGRLAEQR